VETLRGETPTPPAPCVSTGSAGLWQTALQHPTDDRVPYLGRRMRHCCHQHARLVLMGRAMHTADWVWPWRQLEAPAPWTGPKSRLALLSNCRGSRKVEKLFQTPWGSEFNSA
jgi:hypothetical protein